MDDLERILDKLRKIEALYRGATTEGERAAAASSAERLREKAGRLEAELETEWQFSMPDGWNRDLFVAICRKHGVRPFRYRRQRRTTVMCRATKSMIDGTIWPEYLAFSDVLQRYLHGITRRVISDVLGQSGAEEAEEDPPPELGE
ncbi:MAG: hypothetical protein EA398_16910 [Deltaproteobacteria bacterium]|nr:MAG: hypothetical protein EA398_16910 [Deltaproteobacteria bacterium]